MTRVLQISYYPALQPLTGGERRIDAMRQLMNILRLDYRILGVYHSYQNGDLGEHFVQLPSDVSNWVFQNMNEWELRMSDAVLMSPEMRNRWDSEVSEYQPDVIWLEHPYQWPLIKDYAIKNRCIVIYDSHNVEYKLKTNVMSGSTFSKCYSRRRYFEIEVDLACHSDLILCCSASDADDYKKFGARCYVLPNGSNNPILPQDREAASEVEKIAGDAYIVSYISSPHLPNWYGLRDLVLPAMKNNFHRNIKLFLMGGVCRLYKDWENENGSLPNVILYPECSEIQKSEIFRRTNLILLPITSGGGTNLKTAEALLSGKPILATQIAFRGFEQFSNSNGCTVVSDNEFRKILNDKLTFQNENCSDKYLRADVRAHCEWTSILENAKTFFKMNYDF